ncbi:MAG: transcriptional repressor [Roseburia sp.]|nr:transcriptional repressor [Roseburia sp.]MCM1279780.1 transcriptional repressor [Robinsoniella sp.]
MAPLKYSRQREAIKEFLMERKDHPTADMVYLGLLDKFPNLSLGTVYRNLTLLSDTGEINRLRLGDGVDHFDGNTMPHYHFICEKCGKVMDLETKDFDAAIDLAASSFSGKIKGHVTYFYGECPDCFDNSCA